ncbi:uncharacterized protein VDAG_06127 [Verticillium dahliae VdLs.17]|uniref:Uncharacterized protein n=1 Tax=Verticillium dahliae (strain VdLs.17 / ATCC MYA-4575 / FGSC 10137) TaxID=498257 RepID=G2X8I6_VERDV|nr:uncharacterized protein VDAG_06127 [Verticillium dahliae VdLs.17]EGY15273.1 hypothetical protein VDAG_06127 [Verticillium dahliae VdLs.17]KAH6697920.1 hypothetical protein EV126DRAFT_479485 [Verticillium dahliae]
MHCSPAGIKHPSTSAGGDRGLTSALCQYKKDSSFRNRQSTTVSMTDPRSNPTVILLALVSLSDFWHQHTWHSSSSLYTISWPLIRTKIPITEWLVLTKTCEMQRLRPSRVQSSNQPVTSPTNAVAELNSEESIQRRNEVDCSSSSQPTSLGLREEITIPQSDRDLPDHQTVCNYEAESDEEWSPNPIDQFILGSRLSRWLFPKRSSLKNPDPFARDMHKAFDNYILAFCDGQSITGLAVLSSAFATLGGPSGISAYHWQIAAHLAWLANITHLVGLTFLRDYLRQRPLHRNVRLVPTTISLLLLLVALFPTGWFNWLYSDRHEGANPASPSSYARCFFNVQTATQRALGSSDMRVGFPKGSGSSMVFSILFLSMSFGIRLIKLSRRGSDFFRDVIRRNARRKLLQLAVDTTARFKPTSPRLNFVRQYFFINPIIAILMTARIHTDVVTSTFSEVMLAWVAVLWVTIRIVATRASVQLDENGFTFGQIIAVLLLTGPTIAAATAVWPLLTRRRMPQDRCQTQPVPSSWLGEGFVICGMSFIPLQYLFDAHDQINFTMYYHKKTLELANKSMSYQAPWTYLIVMTVLWTTIWCLVAIVLAATFFLNLRYLQGWEKTSLAVIQMESGIPCQVSGRYWSPRNEAAAEFWPETRT